MNSYRLAMNPMGEQIAMALLIASPLIVTAFWIGTMLRRSVSTREWFGLVLLWAIALPTLKLCFFAVAPASGPTYVPATQYYAPTTPPGGSAPQDYVPLSSPPGTVTVPQGTAEAAAE